MNLHDLVSNLIIDTRDVSLPFFKPELTLCATIIVMLLAKIVPAAKVIPSWVLALAGAVIAFLMAVPGEANPTERVELFTGMLVYDGFTAYIRCILLLFLALFVVFTRLSGIPDTEDGADIFTLVFGATLGMCLMASANHLLTVFLAVEMASVPSYALAATLKGRRVSSEAALKYSIYGAGAAGVMLYGISLVAGVANSMHLPTVATQLAVLVPELDSSQLLVLGLGGLLIAVGLAFKLSAVPFHFWCPDVFEGAPAEVNAFLSVASKAAALALLVRVALGVGSIPHSHPASQPVAMAASGLYAVADEAKSEVKPPSEEAVTSATAKATAKADDGKADDSKASSGEAASASDKGPLTLTQKIANLSGVRDFVGKLIALLAVITCTFGNLSAYGQTNIKRLFAYSTIAHAGYMMMAVPALMTVAGHSEGAAQRAVAGLSVYIFCYLFMNLGVFAVIAFLRNAMRSENISDYSGLIRRCPLMVICFSLMLFSLVGLPPLSGFIGKFAVFASLVEAYQVSAEHGVPATYLIVVLVVGSVNTAISLYYYLRVVKIMTIDPDQPDRRPLEFSNAFLQGLYLGLITLPTAALILSWDWLSAWTLAAAQHLLG